MLIFIAQFEGILAVGRPLLYKNIWQNNHGVFKKIFILWKAQWSKLENSNHCSTKEDYS